MTTLVTIKMFTCNRVYIATNVRRGTAKISTSNDTTNVVAGESCARHSSYHEKQHKTSQDISSSFHHVKPRDTIANTQSSHSGPAQSSKIVQQQINGLLPSLVTDESDCSMLHVEPGIRLNRPFVRLHENWTRWVRNKNSHDIPVGTWIASVMIYVIPEWNETTGLTRVTTKFTNMIIPLIR